MPLAAAASASLFRGRQVVLTPLPETDPGAVERVREWWTQCGGIVTLLSAERHDALLSAVSHLPHLLAFALFQCVAQAAQKNPIITSLVAGSFRDMTRIASGHPGIWLDICADNRPAILATLDDLIAGLADMRAVVADDDRDGLERRLQHAREARANLPSRISRPEELAEVRIPIPDRTGAAAEVFTLAAELGVNIPSFEVVHSAEGNRGVAVVLVDAADAELFRGGLMARGFRPAVQRLQ